MVTVYEIVPGSPADKAEIKAGDVLHTVNGHEVNDVLDYRFFIFENRLELRLSRDGVFFQVKIRKDRYADIGLEFETYLMDKKRSCHNRCIFCFIDQLPEGMRETLYFKDDDSRLSFLLGNYITLTNLKDSDIERIIAMHMSPINVSVHTTNPELRVKMMRNKRAGEVLGYLERMAEAGITLNCQIVLCRGINDGEELERSMRDLAALYPAIGSVSVVPSGLTKHREGLYPLTQFTPEECCRVIRQVESFADSCMEKYGTRLFFCGDELYLRAGLPLHGEEYYEDFAQIENGVGMMASLEAEFDFALEGGTVHSDEADCESGVSPADNTENAVNLHKNSENIACDISESEACRGRIISIATGYAAYGFMRELADKAESASAGLKINVYAIRNDFFGENITVAGLLTAGDIIAQLKDRELGEKLLLPAVTLRAEGDLFLDGLSPEDVSRELSVPIEFVKNDGAELCSVLLSGAKN